MTDSDDVAALVWSHLIRQAEATREFLEKRIARLPHVTGVAINLRLMVEGTVTAPAAPPDLLELLLDDLEEQIAERYPELLIDLFVARETPPEEGDVHEGDDRPSGP